MNFVDGWWKPLSEVYANEPDPDTRQEMMEELQQEDRLEPIDGCVEENVGWMMLDTIDVEVEFYNFIWEFPENTWDLCYQRPPVIASW